MSNFDSSSETRTSAIVKMEGIPAPIESLEEISSWRRFLRWLNPFTRQGGKLAKYGAGLARAYAEAEVAVKVGEAYKVAEEAAELAARADTQRNEACLAYNKALDEALNDERPEGKALKLAKILSENPEVTEQLQVVSEIMDRLNFNRGTTVEIITPPLLEGNEIDN